MGYTLVLGFGIQMNHWSNYQYVIKAKKIKSLYYFQFYLIGIDIWHILTTKGISCTIKCTHSKNM